jgi:hypothetical protein
MSPTASLLLKIAVFKAASTEFKVCIVTQLIHPYIRLRKEIQHQKRQRQAVDVLNTLIGI